MYNTDDRLLKAVIAVLNKKDKYVTEMRKKLRHGWYTLNGEVRFLCNITSDNMIAYQRMKDIEPDRYRMVRIIDDVWFCKAEKTEVEWSNARK